MSQDKFINVREVLQQNSYTTTVDELRNRGKSRVRVINAEQISALIEEAVNRTIATTGGVGRDEVKDLVKRSQEKFRQLLAEKEKELAADRERVRQLEQFKDDLSKATAELERIRIVEIELRRQNEALSNQVAELKLAAKGGGASSEADRLEIERLKKSEAAALKERDILQAQMGELRRLESEFRKGEQDGRKEKDALALQLAELRHAESDLRKSETESRKEKESLLAQIGDLKSALKASEAKRAEAPAPAPVAAAMPPEMVEMLKSLATEVASVKAGLKEAAAKPAAAAAVGGDMTALIEKMDKIGKKVGISAGADASEVNLDAIFNPGGEKMESNIENVEVKERKGGGIAGALERMKALRGGKKKEEKKD